METDFALYVDFDDTLYDTGLFSRDVIRMIAENACVPCRAVSDAVGQFSIHPGLGGYDYAAHVRSYGLDTGSMWQQLEELTQSNDYLYADSAAFIRSARRQGFDPQILSFGEERFQLAKIQPVLPILTGSDPKPLDVTIVGRRKHEHIRESHQGQRGALIDDIPGQDLPEGFTEIHLDRNANLPGPLETQGGYAVSSLAQACQVVGRLCLAPGS